MLRVRELDDLFSAAEILARHPRIVGDRLAILTNGGGAGVLAADRLGDYNGRLASLSDATRSALDAVLPPTWSHGNPVDIIGDADPARYTRALDALMRDDGTDAILVMNCPTALASGTTVAQEIVAVLQRNAPTAGGRPSRLLPAGSATRRAARPASCLLPRASPATPRPPRPSTASRSSCATRRRRKR